MKRTRYQGVTEILSYNRGFYLGVLAGALATAAASFFLPSLGRWAVLAGTGSALLWMFVSLAVSHYVYDLSSLYSLSWLTVRPRSWVNIHAGLDQTTPLLTAKLPGSRFRVFDIFDPQQMTEPSIQRARELSGTYGSQQASWQSLPAAEEEFDTVFLIFAAHELRKPAARHALFGEVARVLKPAGSVILVEHLRDWPNFLAYGPGCLHFHSRRQWTASFQSARLRIKSESSITPFVRLFELSRS